MAENSTLGCILQESTTQGQKGHMAGYSSYHCAGNMVNQSGHPWKSDKVKCKG